MGDERWQRIKELLQEAPARDPELRPAFLAETCGGGQGLRREVEELLRNDAEAEAKGS